MYRNCDDKAVKFNDKFRVIFFDFKPIWYHRGLTSTWRMKVTYLWEIFISVSGWWRLAGVGMGVVGCVTPPPLLLLTPPHLLCLCNVTDPGLYNQSLSHKGRYNVWYFHFFRMRIGLLHHQKKMTRKRLVSSFLLSVLMNNSAYSDNETKII